MIALFFRFLYCVRVPKRNLHLALLTNDFFFVARLFLFVSGQRKDTTYLLLQRPSNNLGNAMILRNYPRLSSSPTANARIAALMVSHIFTGFKKNFDIRLFTQPLWLIGARRNVFLAIVSVGLSIKLEIYRVCLAFVHSAYAHRAKCNSVMRFQRGRRMLLVSPTLPERKADGYIHDRPSGETTRARGLNMSCCV